MDPVTQGICGTLASQSIAPKKYYKLAAIVGWLGGMAADLDTLIRSSSDPILFLEYHRQFTHSLFFIPIGGLIIGFLLWLITLKKYSFKKLWLYTTIGYATHALLDANTSYGTLLLWPFSNYRFAWDTIAIVDPFFSLPLLTLCLIGFFKKKKIYPIVGIIFAFIYLSFGYYQRTQVVHILEGIIQTKNHEALRIEAKPTIGNNWLWRGIYETQDRFYSQAIFIFPFSTPKIYEGKSSLKITQIEKHFPHLSKDSQAYQDIERFRKFSKNYLALHPDYNHIIGDFRYSILPQSNIPLWGIDINTKKPEDHVVYLFFRNVNPKRLDIFTKMLLGESL